MLNSRTRAIVFLHCEDAMRNAWVVVGLVLLGFGQTAEAASNSAEEKKGITVEDLGRGLKSAAQNIEKEIPKLGSAIGSAVKKITEKEPEKPSSQDAKQKK
jgi:hypothetical protein